MLASLREFASRTIAKDESPIVVYASLWPFSRVFGVPQEQLARQITEMFLELSNGKRDLLMPSFAAGYKNNLCNLDTEKSSTGLLSEYFRTLPDSKRSLSAFFSFNVIGPRAEEICGLQPQDAWGTGSVYEWMELNNAHFFMIGIHPTHCSYLHRLEWLVRDQINYRFIKEFGGNIIRGGKTYQVRENLFVRSANPPAINDFTPLHNDLLAGGAEIFEIEKLPLSQIRADGILKACLPRMKSDPLFVLKNRQDFE